MSLDVPLETLARTPPDIALDEHALDTVCALALLITQNAAPPGSFTAEQMAPYRERHRAQRAAMRTGVYRTIQALVLLGWIETPS